MHICAVIVLIEDNLTQVIVWQFRATCLSKVSLSVRVLSGSESKWMFLVCRRWISVPDGINLLQLVSAIVTSFKVTKISLHDTYLFNSTEYLLYYSTDYKYLS